MIRQRNRFLFPFLIIISLLIIVAVFFAQSKGKFANIPLPGVAAAGPTSSLEFVRNKAAGCTSAARDQFAKDASRINGVFEDSFILASGTSRIALSPIVADMQRSARDLGALAVDDCGKLVQEKMATAYGEAIAMYLAFMKGDSLGTALIESSTQLQMAYRFLLAYQMDTSAPFLLQDFFAWSKNENNKLTQPSELKYLGEIEGGRARCDDYEMVKRLSFSYHEAATHYSEAGILLDLASEAMLTPTPELCNGHVWLETPSPGN